VGDDTVAEPVGDSACVIVTPSIADNQFVREKKELEKLEEEKLAAAQALVESGEPVISPEEEATEPADGHAEPAPTVQAEAAVTPPATPPPAPKPAGDNVQAPKPLREFTAEEKAAMLKRAKAHAAEVRARKK